MRLKYLYHTIMRRLYRRKGKYQTAAFEYHHNKRKHYKGLIALVAVVLFLWIQPATADFKSEEDKSIETSQKLLNSTVKIEADPLSSGSGFYISPNIIITNEHVIHKAPSNKVTIIKKDLTVCHGEIGYREELIDLAIITTECTGTSLTLATSAVEGQTVIVAGNPANFDFTVSKGIIGAIRNNEIQFDARINFGSSGGVMANLSGEVVGVVVEKSKLDPYIGFSVPFSKVKMFLDRSNYQKIAGINQQ